jgi:hypothetical protein
LITNSTSAALNGRVSTTVPELLDRFDHFWLWIADHRGVVRVSRHEQLGPWSSAQLRLNDALRKIWTTAEPGLERLDDQSRTGDSPPKSHQRQLADKLAFIEEIHFDTLSVAPTRSIWIHESLEDEARRMWEEGQTGS